MKDQRRRIRISVDWTNRLKSSSRPCKLLSWVWSRADISVLPMQQADRFKTLGITPPKGCLMYGPPGTLAERDTSTTS